MSWPKYSSVQAQVSLRFPAQPEYIQPTRVLGEKLISIWFPNYQDRSASSDILLALQETVTNVIRHGYGGRGGEMQIEFRLRDGEFEVEISDWGTPFDPEKIPLPNFETPKPGGYGLYIVKHVTDRVEYRREGERNIVQLMKRFPAESPNGGGQTP